MRRARWNPSGRPGTWPKLGASCHGWRHALSKQRLEQLRLTKKERARLPRSAKRHLDTIGR